MARYILLHWEFLVVSRLRSAHRYTTVAQLTSHKPCTSRFTVRWNVHCSKAALCLFQRTTDQFLVKRSYKTKGYWYTRFIWTVNLHMLQILLIAKSVAVALSSSISIISSLVDSAVDLMSGIIIWWTSRAIQKRNIYSYPGG